MALGQRSWQRSLQRTDGDSCLMPDKECMICYKRTGMSPDMANQLADCPESIRAVELAHDS